MEEQPNITKESLRPRQEKPKEKSKTKLELFMELGKYNETTNTTRIVNKDEFVGEYDSLFFRNGGDWCRDTTMKKSKYKLATMKKNGKINFLWDGPSDEEKKKIEEEFKEKCQITKGNKVYYFKIFGIKDESLGRPIRKDIIEHYKKKSCCVCGSNSDLVCDHKNDLYNDPRVLDTKTQTLDDFQSLCNHCNLQKRQVSKDTRATGKRYGATKIPSLEIWGIDFTTGNETFDPKDINTMVGTYWYDPIDFMKKIKEKINKEKVNNVKE